MVIRTLIRGQHARSIAHRSHNRVACTTRIAQPARFPQARSASDIMQAHATVPNVSEQARPAVLPSMQSKFCRMCGGPMQLIQPQDDKEWRHVCTRCQYIDYFNPKMVVGCIVQHEGKILLCKRAIEPCKGLWTIPAGFMEIGESSAAGAVRETLEEANAAVQILGPYAHLDIPVIGQAYILFRAQLAPPYTYSAGPESLEVELFEPSNIPFEQIAFSSVSITLRHYVADMASGMWHMHHGVIDKISGAAPNDPAAFQLKDHYQIPVGTAQAS